MKISIEAKSRGENRAKLLESLNIKSKRFAKSPAAKIASLDISRGIADAVCNAVTSGGQPLSIGESQWVVKLIQAGVNVGFHAGETAESGSLPPRAEAYIISRRTLTPLVDKECETLIEGGRKAMLQAAAKYGATQLLDDRSNASNDPLLVFGVSSRDSFFPQGVHNAGPNKKDTDYLFQQSLRYLTDDAELGYETYAAVSDGAKACLNAIDKLGEEEFLVPIKCQSHAVSLLLKDVTKSVFGAMIENAARLIGWVRGSSHIHSLIKRSILRFVEVRSATHVLGCNRLLAVHPSLVTLIQQPAYTQYKSTQTLTVRKEFNEMEAIILNQDFWDDVRAFTSILIPVVKTLRLMDQSTVRAKDVLVMWEALGDRLALALSESSLDIERQKHIFRLFTWQWKAAHRPVFDAAWILDPCNRAKVRA